MAAFAQNLSTGPRLTVGDRIRLHWSPEHTFALEGQGDRDAEAGAVQPGDLHLRIGTDS